MIYGAGTSRSGAMTLATYLNDAGLDVGYEATSRQGRYYGVDSDAVKQAYRNLGKGDISYLTAMAFDEIMEVDSDARFIHYVRHPYDVVTSLIAHGTEPVEQAPDSSEPTVKVTAWTPQTGLWHGYGGSSVGVVSMLLRLRNRCWPDVVFNKDDSLIQQVAWYWRMVHERILEFTEQLDADRHIRVYIEECETDYPMLLDWLGSNARPKIQHLNKRPYSKFPLSGQGKSQIVGIAGKLMLTFGYDT